MDSVFPSRKEIIDNKATNNNKYEDVIINKIKSINVDKIDFSKGDFAARSKIIEKQKEFFWIRLFLKEENNILPDTTVKIIYTLSGESIDTKFICHSKKGIDKDTQDQIINYNNEDDKKILCLMIDSDKINYNNKDIPFIKTLFKTSRFYQYQLLKRDDLQFINTLDNQILEYFDVNF